MVGTSITLKEPLRLREVLVHRFSHVVEGEFLEPSTLIWIVWEARKRAGASTSTTSRSGDSCRARLPSPSLNIHADHEEHQAE